MKPEQSSEIKVLHKKFHFLNKNSIKTIYDFSEEDFTRTEKILTILKDIRNPNILVKTLLQQPEKGIGMLLSFQRRYDQLYLQSKNEGQEKKTFSQHTLRFFKYVPKDLLMGICLFLDPYTMANFSLTSKKLASLYFSENFSMYFRNLCVGIFQQSPNKLPQVCRFTEVREYVIKNHKEFGPNSRNAVNNNLRYYVWGQYVLPLQYDKSLMKSFGSYRNLFFKFPRVHFNGIYVCRHQYRIQEDKNLITNTSNVHIVSYFRYFRFLQDGTVLSTVFQSKQKLSVVGEMMGSQNLQEGRKNKNVMIGEYIQRGTSLLVRTYKEGSIFGYNLDIIPSQESNKNEIANTLILKQYTQKIVDQKDIFQVLQQYNEKSPSFFTYFYVSSIRKDNSRLIKAVGL